MDSCKLLVAAAFFPCLLAAQTAVTLSTSPNPSVFGAPVVLTATVTPPTATGKIAFYDGVTILGTKPLATGTASISTILLPAGTRKLRAYYAGDAGTAPGTSNIVTQKVNANPVGSFVNGSPVSQLTNVNPVFVADFNGDGIVDLVGGGPGRAR